MVLSGSKPKFIFSSVLFFVAILSSNAQNNNHDAFHIAITVDTKTHQYYGSFQTGTPSHNVNPLIDLGGSLVSLSCNTSSSTLRFVPCKSTKCKDLKGVCGSNGACTLSSYNPIDNSILSGSLSDDIVTIHKTDGTMVYADTNSTHLDISCVKSKSFNGILGLGRTSLSLTTRLSSAFNIIPKLALCLPSSNDNGFGDLFIGPGPYMFEGGADASDWLQQTGLVRSSKSDEYFVDVKSVKIDKRIVHIDSSLLSLNSETGVGGTKITTTAPYGILHSSIYKAVVGAFAKSAAARNITRVAAVKPFNACFSVKGVHWTELGPRVPLIALELSGRMGSVSWKINGANSMVRVNKNTLCLGFVDGGLKAKTSIVLGGLQLEDNFLVFDLSTSILGFSSSLKPGTCSHFRNF
ncbi:probable aspartic proteinase GIP2 [Humulus lupulus]|uniref:probable aspartic proteinase GIP2 n=1 Tax=Humulus lupulus TaxID=3486 RepID=UPI002B400B57|nr:probable aspartic proteinase GIP2 [Humulus lupulus]